MKLQELIDQTELDMTEQQVKAYFLGALCAEKPMPVSKMVDELLSETPEAKGTLQNELKKLYEELAKNKSGELSKLFPENKNLTAYMENSKDQLDYFLTAMSLSGTNADSCKDEDLAGFIEELEEATETMDDYLSESDPDQDEGKEFKEYFVEMWADFVSSVK